MSTRLDYPYATDLEAAGSKKKAQTVTGRPTGRSRPVHWQHNRELPPPQPTILPNVVRSTPPPYPVKEMIPYNLLLRSNSPVNIRASADAYETEEKMRVMESRLGLTEKSNRALLEEVLRLQNELRVLVAQNERAIRDERNARTQLDASVNIVNDLISQLASRIKGAEDRLNDERGAISTLLSQTRGVEQAMKASQQELTIRKDQHGGKLLELQTKVIESDRAREQLERLLYNMTDELRLVRNKLDGQQGEFQTMLTDLKLRSRRLEEENKLQLDALRKHGDAQSHSDQNTTYLRGQVESRLSELRDVIVDLRGRQDVEINERRSLEQLLQQKVNELHMALGEQNRKREEAMHALDMISREREHAADQEKIRLANKLTENLEEINKRLINKEIKLREEIQDKYQQLEKVLQIEVDKRAHHEVKMREENDERWGLLKKLCEEELNAIREALKTERGKNKESVHKLDESISLLEKQLQEMKRQSDKVIAAEIKSRKEHERHTKENIDHVHEKLQVATATLQQAIGGVNGHLANHTEKMRQELKGMIEVSEQGTTRAMTDLDVRMQSLKQKVGSLEAALDHRIAELVNLHLNPETLEMNEATAALAQNIREKVESISLWQDVTSQTIRELNQSIQQMPNDIYAIEEKQKLLRSELESRVTSEAESRIRDVENLKQELTILSQRKQPQAVTQQDLQEVQGTVRKLAESIQTVKTVLGMKIQSEQKLRTETTRRLEDDIDDLQRKVRPMLNNPNFIKDPHVNGDKEGVNRWGVYNAYRWLTWKSRLMWFKWKTSSRNPPGPSRPSSNARKDDGRNDVPTPTPRSQKTSRPATRNSVENRSRPATRNSNNGQTPTDKRPGNSRPTSRNNNNSRNANTPTDKPSNSRPGSKNSKEAGKEGGGEREGPTW
ncbi:coiled-coil domain-containing protein 154-like isoform X2 [Littorina saxatilis]|uniref:coiled-coil domain-containing protein 154-like isoform X2 n=1 Tax=Littorina saxatilis TaxID=31220 RepID=UPI0038B42981